ncbi:MAG: T9SS type A sorting domain-containing protein [Sphingobacteriales bacterium]|nr:T9SS type A sorting domain-containing protein [Sphingobacteriales bacterium]
MDRFLQIAAIQNASGSNGGMEILRLFQILWLSEILILFILNLLSLAVPAENWRMWIDYNSNYTFDDSGELVFEQAIPTANNVSGSFTVPANLTDNSTRLRVAMSYDTLSPSCGIFNYGEVEDYSIYLRSYCSSLGQTVTDEWIGGVQIGDFSNTSGANGGYIFFNNLTVSLEQGASYPLTLTPQFSGQTWPEYWTIYIDYNHDGDFSDSGELAYSSGGTSNAAVSGTLTVPAATIIGSTRLRVVMRYNTQGAACGTYDYGETEDYVAIISAPAPPLCPATATLSDALGTQVFTQQVSDYIIANNTVSGTAAVIYDAANYIDLTDGFWAQDSCDFTAMIAGCAPAANKPTPAVAVKNQQTATGIAATKEPTPLMLQVFPNPSRGNSTLRFSAEEGGKRVVIELYNIQGKIVQHLYEGSAANTMQEVPINTTQLPAGLYWVRMQNETGTSQVIKLAVQ